LLHVESRVTLEFTRTIPADAFSALVSHLPDPSTTKLRVAGMISSVILTNLEEELLLVRNPARNDTFGASIYWHNMDRAKLLELYQAIIRPAGAQGPPQLLLEYAEWRGVGEANSSQTLTVRVTPYQLSLKSNAAFREGIVVPNQALARLQSVADALAIPYVLESNTPHCQNTGTTASMI
jgi:hypothetical protein